MFILEAEQDVDDKFSNETREFQKAVMGETLDCQTRRLNYKVMTVSQNLQFQSWTPDLVNDQQGWQNIKPILDSVPAFIPTLQVTLQWRQL